MARSYFWYASIFIAFMLTTVIVRWISVYHFKDNFAKGSSVFVFQDNLKYKSNDSKKLKNLKIKCNVNLRTNKDRLDVYLDERRKRIQLVEDVCLEHAEMLSDVFERNSPMIIDREHRVLFEPVAKIASSTWKKIFSHIVLPEYQELAHEDVDKIQDVHHLNMTHLPDLPKREQKEALERYYKVTFVRDPFQRLLSAFRNKLMKTKNPFFRQKYGPSITMWDKTFRQKANANTSATVGGITYTFRSFLRYLAVTDPKDYNNHWARITDVVLPCKIKYDFIGKIETLEEDFNYISKCRIHQGKLSSFYPTKKSETNSLYEEYYKSVDSFDLLQVYDTFQMDFKMFGYPTPSIVTQLLQRFSDKIIA